CQNALHLLPFIKRAFAFVEFSNDRESELLEATKHCLELGNNHLSCVCFDVLTLLCLSHECGSDKARAIHNLLVKFRPDSTLIQLFVPWLLSVSVSISQFGDRSAITYGLDVVFEGIQCDLDEVLVAGKTAV